MQPGDVACVIGAADAKRRAKDNSGVAKLARSLGDEPKISATSAAAG
jgi:hypothetical protein